MDTFDLSIQLSRLREEIELCKAKEEYKRLLRLQKKARFDIIELSWNEAEHPRDKRGRFASIGGSSLTEAQYQTVLQVMKDQKISGILEKKVTPIDLKDYGFNDAHINGERGRGISKADAQHFVNTAKIEITRWNGVMKIFLSREGAAYVNTSKKMINTSYQSEKYDEKVKSVMEAVKDE